MDDWTQREFENGPTGRKHADGIAGMQRADGRAGQRWADGCASRQQADEYADLQQADGRLTFQVAWRDAEGFPHRLNLASCRADVEGVVPDTTTEGAEIPASGDIEAKVVRCGECWQVWVRTKNPVRLTEASATLELDLASADVLFLNGYNSWTDSRERSPRDAMPGLTWTPRMAVEHWVLDASGDYRFARQDARPGHQHGVGYGYIRRRGQRVRGANGEVTLFGETQPDVGVTVIYEDLQRGILTFEKEGPGRTLAVGEWLPVLSLFVAHGPLEQVFRRYVAAMGVERRPAPPLVGYSSWYRHYQDIDAHVLDYDLYGAEGRLCALPLGKARAVFQIDDGYAKVGDWTIPDPRRFPQGMGAMARDIDAAGLLPGLWMAPFVCERDSQTFAKHPDWLLRDGQNHPVMAGSHWSGSYALDTRNPQVREHVRTSLDTAVRIWGFRFLKLDFLYAAALVPHDGMNRGELMADALDLLRDSVPEGTLFDFCGVPVMSAFGRCEYCRIGCDVGLDWDGQPFMRMAGRERVSTKNSLGNTRGRAHLNGVVFLNDPDVFFLRGNVRLSREERNRLLEADTHLGGMLLTSDDMGAWNAEQTDVFAAAVETFISRFDDLDAWEGA